MHTALIILPDSANAKARADALHKALHASGVRLNRMTRVHQSGPQQLMFIVGVPTAAVRAKVETIAKRFGAHVVHVDADDIARAGGKVIGHLQHATEQEVKTRSHMRHSDGRHYVIRSVKHLTDRLDAIHAHVKRLKDEIGGGK
jgi:hypothetical protein